jgi:hypothetical protein
MKALSFIGLVIAGALILLGISTRQNAGSVLSNAIIVGGGIIAVFVVGVWIAVYVKDHRK